ncbi:MAG TPA: hypothetical protein VGG72_03225 [Bryobacteraceae bacterium]|jgi:uncharacterized protein (TIGR03437 family)
MRRLKISLFAFLCVGVAAEVASGQTVNAVVNSASGLIQGLPNSGIAQGSIFLVVGSGLGPSTLVTATSNFQSTSVGGTSVSIVVGSTTVNALMYYSSATQVAALLPSNTPTGSGSLTVTYNGTASASVPVSIVANNVGIFTVSQNGQGVAILTYPDYSVVSAVPGTGSLGGGGPYTYGGAANPGDTLTLWATGLGPVSGSDAAGSGLGVNMPSIPVKLWLGGVAITPTYQGRSGCCIGEDQIVFAVPSGVPTGCAVPFAVQIGNQVSNYAAIPIANGSRSCTMQNPAYTNASAQILTTRSGPINYGFFSLGRTIASSSSSGLTYEDFGNGTFEQVTVSPANQPTVLSSLDIPPFGTCTTGNSNVSTQPLLNVVTGDDAGTIVVNGPFPDNPVTMKKTGGTGVATSYNSIFTPAGAYFSGGAYTIVAGGGAAIGPFTIPFTITQTPTWPSSDQALLFANGNGVVRSNGLTINWTGGSSAYWIEITGSGITSATDTSSSGVAATFACWVPSTAGKFTVPAAILLTLPGGINAELDFKPTLPPFTFSATGLDEGLVLFQYQTTFFFPLN